jgi:hypothetical protein
MSEQNPPLVTRAPKDPENASEKPENERAIYQGQREHELELNRATAAYEHAIVSPLFLLNGGAVVAFLTLLGTATKKESTLSMDIAVATLAVFVWALSLLVAAAEVRAGYESQQRFTRAVRTRRQLMEHALPSRSALTEVLQPAPDKFIRADVLNNLTRLMEEARDRQSEWLWRTQLSLVGFIAGAVVAAGSSVRRPTGRGAARLGQRQGCGRLDRVDFNGSDRCSRGDQHCCEGGAQDLGRRG